MSFERFSKRSEWDARPNPLSMLLAEKRLRNEKLLDLTESNPTRCNFKFYKDFDVLLLSAENLRYDPDPRGLLKAREAVCRYYAEKGITVVPEQIFLTAGTSEAYHFLFRLLTDAGEAVCCAEPGYPLFDTLAGLNDASLKKYRLKAEENWAIDFPSLETALRGCRAVLTVHPNNPTGNYVSKEEKTTLNALCAKSGCALIADEVFLDFFWKGSAPKSFAANREALTFTLSGVSKILGLPQMKLAWIVVSGPEAERLEAIRRLEVIADAYLSVNTLSQNALGSWLGGREAIHQEILSRVKANRSWLQKALQKKDKGELLPGEGGWYAAFRYQDPKNDEEMALHLLRKKNLLVHPGYFFDFGSDDIIVLSLLPEEKVFEEGIEAYITAF